MKLNIFYGWYIVAAGLILTAYNSAIFIYGWTAFVDPIIITFGWSVAQVSLASSLRGLETGVFNPVFGVAVDRWNPRNLMLFGTIAVSLGTFCLSRTTGLPLYYAGFLIMGLGGSLVTGILPATIVARWFRRDIGKANGILYMGLGIGGVLVPVVVRIVDALTWQKTLFYAAIGYLVLGIPLAFVFRSRPEDYGLLPDGAPAGTVKQRQAPDYNFGTTVGQALRMRAFWYINIVSFFQNCTIATVTMLIIPYLTSMEIQRETASLVVLLFTFISLFSRIPLGMTSDIWRKKYIVAFTLVLLVIGLFSFWLIDKASPFWLILLFSVTYGVGMSGIMALRAPLQAEYFGTRNFGTIFGLNSLSVTFGSVISTPLAGWVYDTYRTYKPVWLGLAIFAVLAVTLMLMLPPAPKPRIPGAAETRRGTQPAAD
jgi:sugar phosphate permease